MNVAPSPGFAALEGRDERMSGRVEMLKRVGVRRVLAAADMAAGEAHAKLVPLLAECNASLAAARMGRDLLYLACMFTRLGHWCDVDDSAMELRANAEPRHVLVRQWELPGGASGKSCPWISHARGQTLPRW